MAELLLSLPSYNPSEGSAKCNERWRKPFDSFRSVALQIPLQPVCIGEQDRIEAPEETRVHRRFKFLQEESAEFARALAQERRETAKGEVQDEVGLKFTRRLLQNYQGGADGNAYITQRLEGQRSGDSQRPDAEVHIYEMFWADLARPTSTFVSFFLAVFQLVLHLPSLSRLAIDTRPDAGPLWKAFQFAQRYASRMLQIVIPLIKIVLLVALFSAAPAVAKVQKLGMVSALLVALAAAVASLVLMDKLSRPQFAHRFSWLVVSFLPALLCGVVTYVSMRDGAWNQGVVLAAVSWLLGALLFWYALGAYQNVQAGIVGTGWICYGVFFVMFWAYRGRGHMLAAASLWTAQWLVVTLRWSWLLLVGFAVAAFLLGGLAWRTESDRAKRAKARAAVRTSRLALAMPAVLFVFITGFIWAGLFSLATKISDPYFKPGVLSVAPGLQWLDNVTRVDLFPHLAVSDIDCYAKNSDPSRKCSEIAQAQTPCVEGRPCDYLKGVLAWSVGYGILGTVLLTAAGLMPLVWWALPSVMTETFPLRQKTQQNGKVQTEPPRTSSNRESVWLGGWISRGLDSTSLVTYISWAAIFVIPVVFSFTGHWRDWFEETTRALVSQVIAIAASTALLTALVRYSSPVLRCILDVDTYLRGGPTAATPRAKIFERYASLLRYVAQFRGPDARGYDSVVIVAHSLGSLISADLFRLLHAQRNDPELSTLGFGPVPPANRVPIQLFTMGNPLRQLLNRFFPYLYSWVREHPDNGLQPLPRPSTIPPNTISAEALPDPAHLGIDRWLNAYRTGDYVGRSLWLDEWYQRTAAGTGIYPAPILTAVGVRRLEFCIGAGAHTHYWDDTAPDIADRLNQLI
jgi:hypothetical protein